MSLAEQGLLDLGNGEMLRPLVLSHGLGVDSTAVLVLWRQMGIRPDLIMFADTGSENPLTYRYRSVIDLYLSAIGFPPLTVVQYAPRHGHYDSLLTDTLVKGMMPSLAYGRKGCSVKWKIDAQMAFLRRWRPALECWSRHGRIRHAIGYDAGPKDSARGVATGDTDLEEYIYPLREANWDREKCKQEIAADALLVEIATKVGVPVVPPKSACIFCPSTKPNELVEMAESDPTSTILALLVESEALPRSTQIEGLWRRGTRRRPGSWNEFLDAQHSEAEIHEAIETLFSPAPYSPSLSKAPDTARFAVVYPGIDTRFTTDFRTATHEAGLSGTLYVRIRGRWYFTRRNSAPAYHPKEAA